MKKRVRNKLVIWLGPGLIGGLRLLFGLKKLKNREFDLNNKGSMLHEQ